MMNWYKNLKMRGKLLISFSILALFAIIIGVIGMLGINTINKSYSDTIHAVNENLELSSNLLYTFSLNRVEIREGLLDTYETGVPDMDMSAIRQNDELIKGYIADYGQLLIEHTEFSSYTSSELKTLEENIASYSNVVERVYLLIGDSKPGEATALLRNEGVPYAQLVTDMLRNGYSKALTLADVAIEANEQEASATLLRLVIALLIVLVIAFVFSSGVSRIIRIPIQQLIASTKKVAEGDLRAYTALNTKDEVGELSRSFDEVVRVFSSFDDGLSNLFVDFQEKGDFDARLDDSGYSGDYRVIAGRINGIIGDLVDGTLGLLNALAKYSNGDFNAEIPKMPGKKAIMGKVLGELQTNLQAVNNDVGKLIAEAGNGNLSVRIDQSKYKGDWQKLTAGMNALLDGVVAPVVETIGVLSEMSNGNLKVSVNGNYKGEYLVMKNALNTTLTNLSKYVGEISFVLNEMALENYDLNIDQEYVGDFAEIRQSLLKIISTFSDVMGSINSSSSTVTEGAKQIAQSSMSLAQGATDQADATNNLTVQLEDVNKKTADNAANAVKAKKLAMAAKENADIGMVEMKGMLQSMNDINEASQNISNIIKVIEDIAFQTNLLALNAAIEAARAGQHGKGFTVVADQVRSLAGRSKESAQETAELIEGTVQKVSNGMTYADKTSSMLGSIVTQISDISQLVNGVAESSDEQARTIGAINESVSKISLITQANAALSEEAAAASQELLGQSDILREEIAGFKLKKVKTFGESRPPKTVTALSSDQNSTDNQTTKGSSEAAYKPVLRTPPATPSRSIAPAQKASAATPARPATQAPKASAAASARPIAQASKTPSSAAPKPAAYSVTPKPTASAAAPKPAAKSFTASTGAPKQSSGAVSDKDGGTFYSSYGNAVYDSKDFGKY